MIDKELMKLPGVRQKMPLLGMLAAVQAVVILAQALFLSQSIVLLWQGRGFQVAIPFIGGFFMSFLAREGVNFLRQKMLDGFAYTLSTNLREALLAKTFELGPQLVAQMGTGSLATTAISGIDQVEMYVKLVLSKVLNMMAIPVLLIIPIFLLDWQSGLVLALAFPFAILFMILLGYAAQARAARQYASYQLLSNHFLDSLRGIATLKFFGRSKAYASSIYRTSERFRHATMRTLQLAMLNNFALDFFATLSVATVALFLGLRLMAGTILLFPALATLILAPEYFLPLREFASDYHATLNGKNALAAVLKVLRMPQTVSVSADRSENSATHWSEHSRLSLSALTKVFDSGRGVSDVTATFSGFEKVAIVGASGAGKSTLLNLLAGFLSADSGTASEKLTSDAWRGALSFIPQQTYIFSGTLRENLAFYAPEATNGEIRDAMHLSGLTDLDVALDTKIGSGGRTLSGGQAQRVALCRAFLAKKRDILLLDEPTAHLDIETELEIKAAILPLFDKKLVFLATHRLHWLPQMDRVIVLNDGRVAGIGTHAELKAENAYYNQLLEGMRG
ncbi:MAG: thiol reductant ABC exporter subunit CydD [Streptococcaceae bacterium]|jgi:ATP-binding cassette subfamily C protein CydD|nr:thiol reductant ABC exporter subunit CydD [Streptococcaceae bacterium]